MNRETCVFYASWLEAVETMPEAAQGEALKAVLTYALRGEETAKQGAMTKMLMAMVRPVIESNNKRYENGCKGGEYGKFGGRPRKAETPNKPQENPKKTPNKPQENPYNVNDNVNVNVNENECVCDKSHNNAHTHTRSEIFQKFISWCDINAPLANSFKEPLTQEHFDWLYSTYGGEKMKRCAAELHNKEACVKNRRAITAWKAYMAKIV